MQMSESTQNLGMNAEEEVQPPSPSPPTPTKTEVSMTESISSENLTAAEHRRLEQRREQALLKEQRKKKKEELERIRAEQNLDVAKDRQSKANDRMQFLLKQTDIFAHFLSATHHENDKKTESGRRGKGRMTEQEEDEEILRETSHDVSGAFQATRLTSHPACVSKQFGIMRDYQIAGLNWLIKLYENGINGILADEMGLGKTLQSISLLGYLRDVKGIKGPHLVIVPKSTLHNWIREFNRWCPQIDVFKFHGDQHEREGLKATKLQPSKFEVAVTTYEMCIQEKSALKKFNWAYIMIDEAHRIKNEQSKLSTVVREFSSENRLLITGTPLQNNLHELWALLNFLLPDVFTSSETFDEWFQIKDEEGAVQQDIVQQLHKVLRPFLLRRLKKDVEKSLPPKVETKVFVGMSAMQREWYKKLLMRDIEAINSANSREKTRLLNIIMQLRKCCNHPYLFDGAEPGPPYTTDEHLVQNSGKMVVLDKLLQHLRAQGSRALVFSQMTRVLDILEDYCIFRGFAYCRIDGQTNSQQREDYMDDFNRPDSDKFIFLLSTRAGGLGINLATADTVILYDSDWNPQMDLQAQDRAHRIGQKKEVKVFRFVTEKTVEEKIIERAEYKLHLDALVIQQGRLAEKSTNPTARDLSKMIKFGADQIFRSQSSTVTDEDIEILLASSRQKTEALSGKLKKATLNLESFSMDDGNNMYTFDGIDYTKDENKAPTSVVDSWLELPSRERSKKNFDVDAYYREAFRIHEQRAPSAPRLKQPKIYDYQFFPEELYQLLEQERKAFEYEHRDSICAVTGQNADDFEEAQPLTEEEEKRKESYLTQGFSTWTYGDVRALVRGLENYGEDDFASVAAEVEGKTLKEVEAYFKVFWKKKETLSDWERFQRQIEKAESKRSKLKEIEENLDFCLSRLKDPQKELEFKYTANQGRVFTEDEDRFLVLTTAELGYGNWDQILHRVKTAWEFRFDWFIRSRSVLEVQRRVEVLLRLIEKDNMEVKAKEEEERKQKARTAAKRKRELEAQKKEAEKKQAALAKEKKKLTEAQKKRAEKEKKKKLTAATKRKVPPPAKNAKKARTKK